MDPLNMDPPTDILLVARIPCNASVHYRKARPVRLEETPLINIGPGGISENECVDLEKTLGHIPDMRKFDDPKTFSWAKRSLVGLTIPSPLDGVKFDYMMCMCQDQAAGLPHNEYLEGIFKETMKTGRGTLMAPRTVFGDAFVFRMQPKSNALDKSERARYISMDTDFVESAKYESYAKDVVLAMLLIYPGKGKWE